MAAALLAGMCVAVWAWWTSPEADPAPLPAPSVLSVTLTRPELSVLPQRVPATGSVAAWQEAIIGAEVDGLRLTEVRVNVGDRVQQGQVLARFSPALVQAERAEASAAVALARAEADEAAANQVRAQALDGAGVMSRQQVAQYRAVALTTRARLESAQAAEQKARLRVRQTDVLAPDDGIISARAATVGAVAPAGQELFRLIKDGRLEWRAAVAGRDLARLKPGQAAHLVDTDGAVVEGRVRMLSPVIDATTRSGLVYVDLPQGVSLRAGAFIQGHIETGTGTALTLPHSAVLMRDGFHYVMQVGREGTVSTRKVSVGRLSGERVEVTHGIAATDAVVASGLGFLNDGDSVRVLGTALGSGSRR